jgi:LPS export ABC transporter permease LptF/LPS export ABC transporter permease LptG
VIQTLDRYILKELLPPFAFALALFTFFLLIDRIFQLTELMVGKGVPFPLVLQLLLLLLPSFLSFTLPMAALVAILLVTGRMAADLEVVAFKAAGGSPIRLFRPFLGFALAVSLLTGILSLVASPWAYGAVEQHLFRILKARVAAGITERVFNTAFGRIVIYVEEVSASQVGLRGLLVSDERDPKIWRVVTAREGRLLTDEEHRRATLRLIDGTINESDVGNPTRYRHTTFGLYDMNLSIDTQLTDAAREDKPEKAMRLSQLLEHARSLRRQGQNYSPFLVEFQKRFAVPVAALVFAVIGFSLGIRSHRGGRAVALVGSLAILLVYYFLLTRLEGVALNRRIPAWLAMWTPNLLGGCVGALLLRAAVSGVPATWTAAFSRLRGLRSDTGPAGEGRPRDRRQGRPQGWRESTHIIDRYLVREFFTYLGYGVGVGSALFMVVDLLQNLDRYLRIKPPLQYILEHFLYRLPASLYQGLPVITLVSTLFLFLTLTRQHELTALKAAGVSLYRVSLPILLVASGISLGAVVFQETLLPVLNAKGDEIDRVKIRGDLPRHLQTQTKIWFRSSDTRFFHMDLLSPVSGEMYGVTILEIDRNYRLVNRLDAVRAGWTREGWKFENGIFRELGVNNEVRAVPFSLATIELAEAVEDFSQLQKPPDTMSFLELREYLAKLQESGHRVGKYIVQLYGKIAFPLIHVIMALVAIPFALQSPRGGRMIGIGLAVLIALGYWIVHSVAIALAKVDLLPPLVAAWTANIVFAGLGLSFFLRART